MGPLMAKSLSVKDAPSPTIVPMIDALRRPHRLWTRPDVLQRPSPGPAARGIYAWFFREIPKGVPIENCTTHDGFTLLYVGIAPSREGSKATLRRRLRQHYAGNASASTLRLTLGCLLSLPLMPVCKTKRLDDDPLPSLSDAFLAVLRRTFTDIDEPDPDPTSLIFNSDHASEIVTFVRQWRDVDRIVIHCMAGQSRSPGIALGLCDLFGWGLGDMEERYPWANPWVRNELVRVGREVLNQAPTHNERTPDGH
jgi:hypothetical protein